MDIRYFIGIDIAKLTLDWAVYDGKKIVLQTSSPNTIAGIKTALRLLKALPGWNPQQAIFCMEHTGIYNAHLLDFLHKLHFPIWLESSLQIKKAGGLQRGKIDSIDAQRIAEYARSGGPVSLPRSASPMGAAPPDCSKVSIVECYSSSAYQRVQPAGLSSN
ncbi:MULTISPECIES: transposase [unclassified Spirosoma]|uniref:IS110 family transposase n=1 Tax=unclassified Spirosoma TaxID=2621999 RepID=UPI000AD80976|nr:MULTISPECIES: transposase [unclassified Spirosoma]